MARRYKMTPRRKAALKKAQAASARKRRNRTVKRTAAVLGVAGTVTAIGVAGYASRSYVRHLAKGGPPRPSPFHYQLALPAGRTVVKVKKVKRAMPERKGVFKVSSGGTAEYIRHPRPLYDRRRRAGIETGYEKKARGSYTGLSPRTLRRRAAKRG